MSETDQGRRYEDCRRLYVKHGGRNVKRIEREMLELGHERFSRRILYNRTENGVSKPGWIDRYNWRRSLIDNGKLIIENSKPAHPNNSAHCSQEGRPRPCPLGGNPSGSEGELPGSRRPRFDGAHSLPVVFPPAGAPFSSWLKRVSPGMTWDWRHQRLLYKYLREVTDGSLKRLMIFMPPRHGKSELVTVRYTAWRMQQDQKMNVILGSYNQRLANRFSRKVRRVLAASTDDAGNADAPVRNRNADAPVRNEGEARTSSSHQTAPVHPDADASIADGGVRVPASDPLGRRPGEALCPERYDETALENLRRKLGSYSFSSLFQQRPSPAEGGIFKRHWFRHIVDAPPAGLIWKRGWDLAVSTRTGSDFTASFRCAFDAAGFLYIADGIRLKIEFPDQRRLIIDRILKEPNTEHGIELALHGQAIIQDLRRVPQIRSAAFRGVKVEGDKLTRALPWAALAEDGKVILVRGPWNNDLINEAASFPSATHDDQLDAISIAVKMLSRISRKAYGF